MADSHKIKQETNVKSKILFADGNRKPKAEN